MWLSQSSTTVLNSLLANPPKMDRTHKSRTWRWCLTPYPSNIMYTLFLWAVFPFLLTIFTIFIAQYTLSFLPSPKGLSTPQTMFSEARACLYENALNNLGPRVIDTKNEKETQEWLLAQIRNITSMGGHNLLVEIQTQNFLFNFTVLTNFIVRLSDNRMNANTSNALLISSHYDTVEFSHGVIDDSTGVSVMLELLNNLMNRFQASPPTFPVIFNFNDGEEAGLNGAKAFTMYHPWANTTKRFLNMDSDGSHGKNLMFRLFPSSIINEYRVAPYPHTTVIGEELVEYIPSDTDYTVYKNNGYPGFDFAFYLDGYTYHTGLDIQQGVDKGALQQLGENSLALITYILNPDSHILDNDNTLSLMPYIYFDIFGQILVSYSQFTSDLVQSLFIAFVIVSCIIILLVDHIIYYFWDKYRREDDNQRITIYHYLKKNLSAAFGIRLLLITIYFASYVLSVIFGVLVALLMSLIMTGLQPMFWFCNPLTAVPLYGFTCATIMIIIQFLSYLLISGIFDCACIKKHRRTDIEELEDDGETIEQFFCYGLDDERYMALFIFWALAMLVSVASRLRSTYLALVFSVFVVGIAYIILLIERIAVWTNLCRIMSGSGYLAATPRGTVPAETYNVEPTISRGEKVAQAILRYQIHWSIVPSIALLFPVMISIDHLERLLRTMIPIIGRLNSPGTVGFPPDVLVAGVTSGFIAICMVSMLPSTHRATNFIKMITVGVLATILSLIVSCTLFPYSATTPKRLYVNHNTTFSYDVSPYNSSLANVSSLSYPVSGNARVQSVDYRPVLPILDDFEKLSGKKLNKTCSTGYTCQFPLSSPFNDTTFQLLNVIAYNRTRIDAIRVNHKFTFSIAHRSNYRVSIGVPYDNNVTVNSLTLNKNDINRRMGKYTYNNYDNSSRLVINKYGLPSNQTIIDVDVTASDVLPVLYLTVNLYTCDDIAQTWLRELYTYINYVTATGAGHCKLLNEMAMITIRLPSS